MRGRGFTQEPKFFHIKLLDYGVNLFYRQNTHT